MALWFLFLFSSCFDLVWLHGWPQDWTASASAYPDKKFVLLGLWFGEVIDNFQWNPCLPEDCCSHGAEKPYLEMNNYWVRVGVFSVKRNWVVVKNCIHLWSGLHNVYTCVISEMYEG